MAVAKMPTAPLPLTLIVATTPSLGIGRTGSLPWPPLRHEMAYFARVTRRVPKESRKVNAVLMGRKTWESIPAKFRPLKGRLNVVISRTLTLGEPAAESRSTWNRVRWSLDDEGRKDGTGVVSFTGLDGAVQGLNEWSESNPGEGDPQDQMQLNRVFVIGGAEIYGASLRLPGAERVLRTKIRKEFDCDVHFPLPLGEENAWHLANKAQLDAWVGEQVPEGVQSEKEVDWEFEMWERSG